MHKFVFTTFYYLFLKTYFVPDIPFAKRLLESFPMKLSIMFYLFVFWKNALFEKNHKCLIFLEIYWESKDFRIQIGKVLPEIQTQAMFY